ERMPEMPAKWSISLHEKRSICFRLHGFCCAFHEIIFLLSLQERNLPPCIEEFSQSWQPFRPLSNPGRALSLSVEVRLHTCPDCNGNWWGFVALLVVLAQALFQVALV